MVNIPANSRGLRPLWLIGAIVVSAVLAFIRRLRVRACLRKVYSRNNLTGDIADFYDARSAAWESVWGEHMHHGLYDVVDREKLSGSKAQVRTMDEMLRFSGVDVTSCSRILDVGCGIGGASRYLASKGGNKCIVSAITLSPVQAARATELNNATGLGYRVLTKVENVLNSSFSDSTFDMVWSLESAEHIPDKQKFIQQCKRMLKPNGEMVMLVWCVRECTPPFRTNEQFSIRRIMEEYCLPRVAAPSEYVTELIRAGFRDVKYEDWTDRAAPFWWEVARTAVFNPNGWRALLHYGWPLIKSALAMRHVIAGIRQGVFRLVVFSARVPTSREVQRERENEICC